jgi:HAMP domain-containing protein
MAKKIAGFALALLLLVAVLGAAAYFAKDWLGGALSNLEKKLAEVDRKAGETIAEAQAENQLLVQQNLQLRSEDAKNELEKAALLKEIAGVRKDLAKALEELRTAPPEALLAKARAYLETEEISLRTNAAAETEAVFTVPAFRLDVGALEEWKTWKFEFIPRLERDVKIQEGQLVAVRTERDNLTTIVGNKDKEIGAKDEKISARDDVIKTLKKKNAFRRVLDFLAGLGTGLLAFLFK